MSLLETLATLGFGANMAAMSWVMKTLFQMRMELSEMHADASARLKEHNKRLDRLERSMHRVRD